MTYPYKMWVLVLTLWVDHNVALRRVENLGSWFVCMDVRDKIAKSDVVLDSRCVEEWVDAAH